MTTDVHNDGDDDDRLWMRTAACRGVDVEYFFPPLRPRLTRRDRRRVEMALRVCARCPVIADCREYASSYHAVGVWGGELRTQASLRTLEARP